MRISIRGSECVCYHKGAAPFVFHISPSFSLQSLVENGIRKVLSNLIFMFSALHTIELQWLEHLKNHENMFQTGVVRAIEC